MMIGSVGVAPSAACRPGSVPCATSTLTFDRTSSTASGGQRGQIPVHAPKVHDQVLAILEAVDLQLVDEGFVKRGATKRYAGTAEKADARDSVGRLRSHHQRPRGRATEPRDERAPFHSMTSSARASSIGGTARLSIRAVSALMISSNLVDCTTGKSAGLTPLSMRPA